MKTDIALKLVSLLFEYWQERGIRLQEVAELQEKAAKEGREITQEELQVLSNRAHSAINDIGT